MAEINWKVPDDWPLTIADRLATLVQQARETHETVVDLNTRMAKLEKREDGHNLRISSLEDSWRTVRNWVLVLVGSLGVLGVSAFVKFLLSIR